MTNELICKDEKELSSVAKAILNLIGEEKIVIFQGEMGVGKTTFIKQLCHHLGSTDEITSPTFSLINEYHSTNGSIYHFDFYRLQNIQEALDIGIDEYLDSGCYCLIEWPEKISSLLPPSLIKIEIETQKDLSRKFRVKNINY